MSDDPIALPTGDPVKPLLSDEALSALIHREVRNFQPPPNKVRDFYENLRASGDLFTKDQVESMLSDAMGVSKEAVWAELGTRRGFGKRI